MEWQDSMIKLTDLFSDRFMRIHTVFGSIDAFFLGWGEWPLHREDVLHVLSSEQWDAYVQKNSRFWSWGMMKIAAVLFHSLKDSFPEH